MRIGKPQCCKPDLLCIGHFLRLLGNRDGSDLPGSRSVRCQPTTLGVGFSFHSSPRHLSLRAAGAGPYVSAIRNPKNWTNLQRLRNRCHKATPSCIYLQRTPVLCLAFWSPNKVTGPSSVQVLSSLKEHRIKPIFCLSGFFHCPSWRLLNFYLSGLP